MNKRKIEAMRVRKEIERERVQCGVKEWNFICQRNTKQSSGINELDWNGMEWSGTEI